MGKFIRMGNCEYGGAPFLGIDVGNVEYNYVPYVGYTNVSPYIIPPIIGVDMLRVYIPRYKFWTADYPNIDPEAIGMAIPERYGDIHNITPVLVDSSTLTYKFNRRSSKALDEVRSDGVALVEGVDYTVDLVNSEFDLATSGLSETDLKCDIRGYTDDGTPAGNLMTNVALILADIYVYILGGQASKLNAVDFAALEAARTEELAVNLDKEAQFADVLERLEAGSLFKFIPNLDDEFTVKYYVSGEPAGTPHLRDEDFVRGTFRMVRDMQQVFQKAQVKYYEDPATEVWQVREDESDIAQFIYRNQESLIVETYLRNAADAEQLAEDYLGTDGGSTRRQHLQYPRRFIEFEVGSYYGFNFIPSQKIKVTTQRADYAGGVLNGVLFRIFDIEKNFHKGTCKIRAVLDTLTY